MIRALQRHFPRQASWTRPQGGLFVWVTLPATVDGDDLFVAARQNGVLYSRGDLFHCDGSSGKQKLRLAYSAATPQQIEAGIETLGSLVKARLDQVEPHGQDSIEAMPIL